jgi:hypothetical protein
MISRIFNCDDWNIEISENNEFLKKHSKNIKYLSSNVFKDFSLFWNVFAMFLNLENFIKKSQQIEVSGKKKQIQNNSWLFQFLIISSEYAEKKIPCGQSDRKFISSDPVHTDVASPFSGP